MNFFRKLSPETKYVIAETARVCACIGLVIFTAQAAENIAGRLLGPSQSAPSAM